MVLFFSLESETIYRVILCLSFCTMGLSSSGKLQTRSSSLTPSISRCLQITQVFIFFPMGSTNRYRFDCGSGVGIVRSTETVKLNNWNNLSVYRHRWDAWIQLNEGKRVQGRSKVGAYAVFFVLRFAWFLFLSVYMTFFIR